jgi:hypothetical protein
MAEPEGLSCGLKMHLAHWLYIVCMILQQPFDIPPLDGLPLPIKGILHPLVALKHPLVVLPTVLQSVI